MRKLHRVQLGYEVGDGSDRWAPPGSEKKRGEGADAQLLGWFGSGLGEFLGHAGEKRRGGREQAVGKKIIGPSDQDQRGRVFLFFCFSFLLKTNLFQNIFKTKFEFPFNL